MIYMQGIHISITDVPLSTFQNDIYAKYSYFYSDVPLSTFQNHACILRLSSKEATIVTKHYQGKIRRNAAE